MKIVNTLQHYVKYGYKTFVVDNFVLDEPSEFDRVLKGEYVYKNSKLFKALKNTVSSLKNLENRNIFIEVQAYFDETPKEKKDNEITKNVQKSKTTEIEKTEDVKVEKVEEVTTELAESTEQKEVNFNQLKSKKRR